MNLIFDELTFRNFLSYGNNETVVNLNSPGTTLIVGEDLDNSADGKSRNGTGKSTIINALSYALYDKPITTIQKSNLVNNINKKDMVVTIKFRKGNDVAFIKRERKTKSGADGNKVTFMLNGKDVSRSSVETNRDIETFIGLPHELFSRIVLFSARHVPFLDLPLSSTSGPNQRDFIEELFGLTELTAKADKLKDEIKSTKSLIQTERAHISSIEEQQNRLSQQITSAKVRVISWEDDTSKAIEELETTIKEVDNVDVVAQQKYFDELSAAKQQRRTIATQLQTLKNSKATLTSKIAKLSDELEHLNNATCPYCEQHFDVSDGVRTNLEQAIDTSKAELVDIEKALGEETDAHDALSVTIDELSDKIVVADVAELVSVASKIDVMKARLVDLKKATNPHLDSLEELESTKLPEADYDKIDELTSLMMHQEFLLKLLTKKDSFVRKALLDKSIPYLNARLNEYLSQLGLPHRVEFTHEMTAEISKMGNPLDFGNLSSGQQARVNFALSLAFRNVLQNLRSTVNVCMMDEVFDVGLDDVGVTLAIKLVKKQTREEGISTFVITHRSEAMSAFDRQLMVQFSKGFSSIVTP